MKRPKKGITVDYNRLEDDLGIPVIATNARDGDGLDRLKDTLHTMSENPIAHKPITIDYPDVIMTAIDELAPSVAEILGDSGLDPRWTALRLLDGDTSIIQTIQEYWDITLSDYDVLMEKIHTMKEDLIFNHRLDINNLREQIVNSIVKKSGNHCKDRHFYRKK